MESAYGLEIPPNLAETCTPRRTALLVYDMQVGIIGQIQDGRELVTRVKHVLEAARVPGLRVFFMRIDEGLLFLAAIVAFLAVMEIAFRVGQRHSARSDDVLRSHVGG